MPTQCNQIFLDFHPLDQRQVRGGFEDGAITSDAGGPLLREVEKRAEIIAQFAGRFRDHRKAERIEHRVEELVASTARGGQGRGSGEGRQPARCDDLVAERRVGGAGVVRGSVTHAGRDGKPQQRIIDAVRGAVLRSP